MFSSEKIINITNENLTLLKLISYIKQNMGVNI